MKRGRPTLTSPKVAWKIHVDARTASKVELLLADPARASVAYGERSKLIEQLLNNWIEAQTKGETE